MNFDQYESVHINPSPPGGIGVGSHVIVRKTDTAFGTYISSEGIAPSDNYIR